MLRHHRWPTFTKGSKVLVHLGAIELVAQTMKDQLAIDREGIAGDLRPSLDDELLNKHNLVARVAEGIVEEGLELLRVSEFVDALAA